MFGWFNAGPDAAGKVLDAGIKGLDAMVFTDEERAELNRKLGENWVELQKVLGSESTTRSVTRRVIAFAVIFPFVGLILAAVVAYKFDPAFSQFIIDVADGKFGWLVVGVGGFYFGPHMLGRMKGAKE
jgi:hypothetical protein